MFPSRQNTNESERQVQYAIWMLERALDLSGPGVEYGSSSALLSVLTTSRSVALFINFRDRAKAPSWNMSRNVRLSLLT